ncbi:MAG TPA: dephospho-CoA kinase [Bacteroidales bacterium]|nr:dephospho-CoA kinase [Bacteroidales bacterium]
MKKPSTDKRPLLIGITGGIGSGKTSVCKVFEALGVPVYCADENAKMLTNACPTIKKQLIELFGNEIYTETGLNRAKLANLIFNNKKALDQVNAIIHPAVNTHFATWVEQHAAKKMLVKEAAILIESGSYKQLDVIITVSTNIEERVNRVRRRDGFLEEDILARMKNQLSDSEREKFADYVINNNDNVQILPVILAIYTKLQL